MSTSAQKRNGTNIISSLPESIICHILSRLPSKEAVRTSVLSKDWRYKWMSAYNIDVTDCEPFKPMSRKWVFIDFMDKLLLYLQHDLKSFRFIYNRKYTNNCFMDWISAAFNRKVESFEVQRLDGNCFVLPVSLLNNNISLRTLKLASMNMSVSCDNSFLHLTDLYLEDVGILSDASNSNLAFSFPVLKTLVLNSCKWPNVKLIEIYSPMLLTFKCDKDIRFSSYWEMEGNEHVIKICNAKLENFESGGYFPENISLHNSTVHRAALRSYPQNHLVEYGLKARKLMEGFSNLVKLELSSHMFEALAQSKQALRLPKFDKLLKLEMFIGGYAEHLLEFLHSAPALKFLKLDSWVKIYDFVEEDSVPHCVTSSLKEVVFINCCSDPIIDLARFFLKHGLALKKVYIQDEDSEMNDVVQWLKTIPKASADAEILPPGSFLKFSACRFGN